MSAWIDIEKVMPQERVSVLMVNDMDWFFSGFVINGRTYTDDGIEIEDITHWQILPTPPPYVER